MNVLKKLGPRFIIGGDYNVKHIAWGARIITPDKGQKLLNAIDSLSCRYHSSRSPTYWPSDSNKTPDLLDFLSAKMFHHTGYTETKGIVDLSSDHTPVMLTLSSAIIRRKKKSMLTNRKTDWDLFRENLHKLIVLKVPLKNKEELEHQTEHFVQLICDAATSSTTPPKELPLDAPSYPWKIRVLIKARRKARKQWHNTRNPAHKNKFNKISNQLNRSIKKFKQDSFHDYLENLGPTEEKNYSLWKGTRRFKRPLTHNPPLKSPEGK